MRQTSPLCPLPCPQAEGAKAKYWETHGSAASAKERNGGAHFVYLQNILKRNAGGAGFVIGGKATVGDVALFNIMDLHVRIFGEQLKEQVCSTERWVALIGAAGCCWLPAAGCLACVRLCLRLTLSSLRGLAAPAPAVPGPRGVPRAHRSSARAEGVPGQQRPPRAGQRKQDGLTAAGRDSGAPAPLATPAGVWLKLKQNH